MENLVKYKIGELEFRTKKEAESYTFSIIESIGCKEIERGNKHFKFFVDLIRNHNQMDKKIGCGIRYFEISKSGNTYYTNLMRIDDTYTNFSWISCSSSQKSNNEEYLKSAMREYVADDILQFSKVQMAVCHSCCEPPNPIYVKYGNPPFLQLYKSFMKINKLEIPTLFDHNQLYQAKFREENLSFADCWLEYHRKHCNLQIFCAECNFKK